MPPNMWNPFSSIPERDQLEVEKILSELGIFESSLCIEVIKSVRHNRNLQECHLQAIKSVISHAAHDINTQHKHYTLIEHNVVLFALYLQHHLGIQKGRNQILRYILEKRHMESKYYCQDVLIHVDQYKIPRSGCHVSCPYIYFSWLRRILYFWGFQHPNSISHYLITIGHTQRQIVGGSEVLSQVDIHKIEHFLKTESLSKEQWVSPDGIENMHGIIICCLRELGVHSETEVTYKILMRRFAYANQLARKK